ncbi:hypothetical protein [Xenorhabdus doucetiae]|uniref:Uncharacterized protein n=1 Tax=Xenorhabdus doucetiae TaxID=351671 RepID=A0A068QWS7_9GAMM|nr:hypothetical protein [Xenorhabdus doucetiae]TYO97169.1 hypothetical protein LY16_03399 [Xenorhabdus doucetiae]CDG19428.1 protein of unknown function [Xenorhabdus doucetiae]
MFFSQQNFPEIRFQPGWFILTYDRPYYSDENQAFIALDHSFDRLIGYYKKTGFYFDARYEGEMYNPERMPKGFFSVTFQWFNFNTNTSGYGECVFIENQKTGCLFEFIRLLKDFIQKAENQ